MPDGVGLPADIVAMFRGAGEVGEHLIEMDWSHIPVGHPSTWSSPLRTAVDIVLSSRFPLVIWWGREHVMLYNEALVPALGDNHPWALGRLGRQIVPEMWPVIGPMLDQVLATGEATWRHDQPLPMKRRGFVEDTYWTYSYSPIRDETGAVAGVFTATTDTTDRVLRERRLQTLSQVGQALDQARSTDQACHAAAAIACRSPQDIPAAAVYLSGVALSPELHRVAAAGDAALPPSPQESESWSSVVAAVLSTAAAQTAELPVTLPDGSSEKRRVALMPLLIPGRRAPVGLLAAAAGLRIAADDDYLSFCSSLTGSLAASLAAIEALEAERRRAQHLAELARAQRGANTTDSCSPSWSVNGHCSTRHSGWPESAAGRSTSRRARSPAHRSFSARWR